MSVTVQQTHVVMKQTQNVAVMKSLPDQTIIKHNSNVNVIKRVVGGPQGPAGIPAAVGLGTADYQIPWWDNTAQIYKPSDETYFYWDATDNVLGVNLIQWKLAPSIAAHEEGQMHWDEDNGCVSVGMPGGSVELQVGLEGLIRVRNVSGAQLPNGRVVYSTGAQGNLPTVDLADNTDPTKMQLLGMTTEAIDDLSNGYITLWGVVRGLDTSLYAAGTHLYLSTNGQWTSTHPSAAADATACIGCVVRQHATEGEIQLKIVPFTLVDTFDGTLRQSVHNASTGTSAATGFTAINDQDYWMTVGIGGSNNTTFPNVAVYYGPGYNDNWYAVDGNKDHVFYTDPTDSHNNSSLSYPRFYIKADGTLRAGATNYETLVLLDDDIPNKKYVDDAIDAKIDDGTVAGQMLYWDHPNTKWTYLSESTDMYWNTTQAGLMLPAVYGLRNSAGTLRFQYNTTYDASFFENVNTGVTPAVIIAGQPPFSALNKAEFRILSNGVFGLSNNANVTRFQLDLDVALKADNLKYYMGAADDAYLTWTGTTLDISTSSLTINSAFTVPVADGAANTAWVTNGAGAVTFTALDHTVHLSHVGTNTHAQIDTHLASSANPHTVTLEQARTAGDTYAGDVNYGANDITNIAAISSAAAALLINDDASQNVNFFASAASGEKPTLSVTGNPVGVSATWSIACNDTPKATYPYAYYTQTGNGHWFAERIIVPSGTKDAPGLQFPGNAADGTDGNTGIYRNSENQFGIAAGGQSYLFTAAAFENQAAIGAYSIRVNTGYAATPTYGFMGAASTRIVGLGMTRKLGTDSLSLCTGSRQTFNVLNTFDLSLLPDAADSETPKFLHYGFPNLATQQLVSMYHSADGVFKFEATTDVDTFLFDVNVQIGNVLYPATDGAANSALVTDGAGTANFTVLDHTVHLTNVGTNTHAQLDSMIDFFNGSFVESFNCLVTSDGATITASLEQSGGGDLTMRFSDGYTTLDCTPADTVTLTAGTVPSPQSNYVYVPLSTKVLTVSTSNWPAEEHIKVSYFFVQTAAYVQADGALINQNWNDHRMGTDGQGHMTHMAERSRRDGAYYFSGIAGAGTDDYTTSAAGSVTYQSTAGVLYQMHKHTYPAKDTSATDDLHVVNAHATDGGAYYETSNLYDITVDTTGATLTNKFFTIVIWGVANKGGEYGPVMANVPNGSYNTQALAEQDASGYTVYNIPREFDLESSTGFLICALLFRKTGGSWTWISTTDLRGRDATAVSGGGAGGTNEFTDNLFRVLNNVDPTKEIAFSASAITTATTRTITMADADVDLADIATLNAHAADLTIHFTEASIDHTAIANIGTNSHAVIDTHIADLTIHFTEASIDHTAITNIGTNTHAQIDTHIASTANPHSVTAAQASAVALTGNETVAGIKTFSSFPVTPSSAPTTDYEVANKKYVDDNAGGSTYIETGTYTGDGTTSQVISLTDSSLVVKAVWSFLRITSTGTTARPFFTSDTIVDDIAAGAAWNPLSDAIEDDRIIAVGTGSFTVDDNGSDNSPNKNGETYNYIVWGTH